MTVKITSPHHNLHLRDHIYYNHAVTKIRLPCQVLAFGWVAGGVCTWRGAGGGFGGWGGGSVYGNKERQTGPETKCRSTVSVNRCIIDSLHNYYATWRLRHARKKSRGRSSYERLTCPHQSHIVQELCESRGGRPGLSVLTSLLVSVDVKIY